MSCMKCGKDTENGQVFCARCLESMEAYPIKPDVHIQLPVRGAKETAKKQTRRGRSRKGRQTESLRRQIRWMWAVIVLLVLALAASMGRDVTIPEIKEPGKNYTYTEPTT